MTREEAIKKAIKIRALLSSPVAGEAAAARHRLQLLMLHHSLSPQDLRAQREAPKVVYQDITQPARDRWAEEDKLKERKRKASNKKSQAQAMAKKLNMRVEHFPGLAHRPWKLVTTEPEGFEGRFKSQPVGNGWPTVYDLIAYLKEAKLAA